MPVSKLESLALKLKWTDDSMRYVNLLLLKLIINQKKIMDKVNFQIFF